MAIGLPAQHTETLQLGREVQDVRATVAHAIQSLSWLIVSEWQNQMEASVSMGMLSWGERITIVFLHNHQISITSQCAFPMQWIDWGKNRQNVQQLASVLRTPPTSRILEPHERIRHEEAEWRSPPPQRPSNEATPEERNWAAAAHLSAFSGFLIPFANIFVPLLIFGQKREESQFIAAHALEAVNFQISMTLYFMGAFFLAAFLIGFLLLPFLFVGNVVLIIVAALKASRGEIYSFPLCLRIKT